MGDRGSPNYENLGNRPELDSDGGYEDVPSYEFEESDVDVKPTKRHRCVKAARKAAPADRSPQLFHVGQCVLTSICDKMVKVTLTDHNYDVVDDSHMYKFKIYTKGPEDQLEETTISCEEGALEPIGSSSSDVTRAVM